MKKCVEQEDLSAAVAYGGVAGLHLLDENMDLDMLCRKPQFKRTH